MTDLITAAALAYVSKDFLAKFLGPTAEYLGDGLKDFTKKRVENVSRIFKKAEAILGDKINEDGKIPPRILRKIIDEGSFIDDELSAQYFGGILASSRTNNNKDDRGVPLLKIVEGLSSYQMRTHYIFYTATKRLFDGSDLIAGNQDDISKMRAFLDMVGYEKAMGFSQDDLPRRRSLVAHSIFGLSKDNLIQGIMVGTKKVLSETFRKSPSEGIIFEPSQLGVELFMWVHGLGNLDFDKFLSSETKIKTEKGIDLPNGSFLPASQLI